ncbi:MAG: C4-type zinc ribbon domain-containing protein [Dehalococcoidales bacterium]|nr:C4-type zinc ribbon domain-containing protein [Dehalococcoidales bacterium]
MSIVRQLYQLQEVDLELESSEQVLNQITSQLGESEAVIEARNMLAGERRHLEELTQQQHSLEWEIDDLTTKLTAAGKELYSGRISNPKELTSLQQEIDSLKARRRNLEDRLLEVMEKVELSTGDVAALGGRLEKLEAEWQNQQQQLHTDLEKVKAVISSLKQKRELVAEQIDPQAIETYQELKKRRGTAVARVGQGICYGCRLSIPITELQRVRSGNLVRCSSCGRILFWD